MSYVDNRVVSIEFDNRNFASKVNDTQKKLTDLDNQINGMQGTEFDMDFSQVNNGIDEVQSKFDYLGTFMTGIMYKLGNDAVELGKKLANSLVIDNVTKGWSKYEQILGSEQKLIAANAGSMEEIKEVLDELTWYTDETSHSMESMVDAIGTFVNYGVELTEASSAMIGIGNAVSKAGGDAADASKAMTGFAKAMGKGYMTYEHFQQEITSSKIATQDFKRELIETAAELGELEKDVNGYYWTSTKYEGTSKETQTKNYVDTATLASQLTEGKFITKDVMLAALSKYSESVQEIRSLVDSGEYDTAAAAIDANREKLEKFSTEAFEYAMQATTLSQALSSITDAMSSRFYNIFESFLGNYQETVNIWTGLANNLYEVFITPLDEWYEAVLVWQCTYTDEMKTGFETLKEIVSSIPNVLYAITDPIKQGIEAAFGWDEEGKAEFLLNLTEKVRDFIKAITLTEDQRRTLRATVEMITRGLQAIVKPLSLILKYVLKLTNKVLTKLFKILGSLGDWFHDMSKAITEWYENFKDMNPLKEWLSTIQEKIDTFKKAAKLAIENAKATKANSKAETKAAQQTQANAKKTAKAVTKAQNEISKSTTATSSSLTETIGVQYEEKKSSRGVSSSINEKTETAEESVDSVKALSEKIKKIFDLFDDFVVISWAIKRTIKNVTNTIKDTIEDISHWLTINKFWKVGDYLTLGLNKPMRLLVVSIALIGNVLQGVIGLIGDGFKGIIRFYIAINKFLKDQFDTSLGEILKKVLTIIWTLYSFYKNHLKEIVDGVKSAITWIIAEIQLIKDRLLYLIDYLAYNPVGQQFVENVKNFFSYVWTAITHLDEFISSVITSFFGIFTSGDSMSKSWKNMTKTVKKETKSVTKDLGKNDNKIEKSAKKAASAVEKAYKKATKSASKASTTLGEVLNVDYTEKFSGRGISSTGTSTSLANAEELTKQVERAQDKTEALGNATETIVDKLGQNETSIIAASTSVVDSAVEATAGVVTAAAETVEKIADEDSIENKTLYEVLISAISNILYTAGQAIVDVLNGDWVEKLFSQKNIDAIDDFLRIVLGGIVKLLKGKAVAEFLVGIGEIASSLSGAIDSLCGWSDGQVKKLEVTKDLLAAFAQVMIVIAGIALFDQVFKTNVLNKTLWGLTAIIALLTLLIGKVLKIMDDLSEIALASAGFKLVGSDGKSSIKRVGIVGFFKAFLLGTEGENINTAITRASGASQMLWAFSHIISTLGNLILKMGLVVTWMAIIPWKRLAQGLIGVAAMIVEIIGIIWLIKTATTKMALSNDATKASIDAFIAFMKPLEWFLITIAAEVAVMSTLLFGVKMTGSDWLKIVSTFGVIAGFIVMLGGMLSAMSYLEKKDVISTNDKTLPRLIKSLGSLSGTLLALGAAVGMIVLAMGAAMFGHNWKEILAGGVSIALMIATLGLAFAMITESLSHMPVGSIQQFDKKLGKQNTFSAMAKILGIIGTTVFALTRSIRKIAASIKNNGWLANIAAFVMVELLITSVAAVLDKLTTAMAAESVASALSENTLTHGLQNFAVSILAIAAAMLAFSLSLQVLASTVNILTKNAKMWTVVKKIMTIGGIILVAVTALTFLTKAFSKIGLNGSSTLFKFGNSMGVATKTEALVNYVGDAEDKTKLGWNAIFRDNPVVLAAIGCSVFCIGVCFAMSILFKSLKNVQKLGFTQLAGVAKIVGVITTFVTILSLIATVMAGAAAILTSKGFIGAITRKAFISIILTFAALATAVTASLYLVIAAVGKLEKIAERFFDMLEDTFNSRDWPELSEEFDNFASIIVGLGTAFGESTNAFKTAIGDWGTAADGGHDKLKGLAQGILWMVAAITAIILVLDWLNEKLGGDEFTDGINTLITNMEKLTDKLGTILTAFTNLMGELIDSWTEIMDQPFKLTTNNIDDAWVAWYKQLYGEDLEVGDTVPIKQRLVSGIANIICDVEDSITRAYVATNGQQFTFTGALLNTMFGNIDTYTELTSGSGGGTSLMGYYWKYMSYMNGLMWGGSADTTTASVVKATGGEDGLGDDTRAELDEKYDAAMQELDDLRAETNFFQSTFSSEYAVVEDLDSAYNQYLKRLTGLSNSASTFGMAMTKGKGTSAYEEMYGLRQVADKVNNTTVSENLIALSNRLLEDIFDYATSNSSKFKNKADDYKFYDTSGNALFNGKRVSEMTGAEYALAAELVETKDALVEADGDMLNVKDSAKAIKKLSKWASKYAEKEGYDVRTYSDSVYGDDIIEHLDSWAYVDEYNASEFYDAIKMLSTPTDELNSTTSDNTAAVKENTAALKGSSTGTSSSASKWDTIDVQYTEKGSSRGTSSSSVGEVTIGKKGNTAVVDVTSTGNKVKLMVNTSANTKDNDKNDLSDWEKLVAEEKAAQAAEDPEWRAIVDNLKAQGKYLTLEQDELNDLLLRTRAGNADFLASQKLWVAVNKDDYDPKQMLILENAINGAEESLRNNTDAVEYNTNTNKVYPDHWDDGVWAAAHYEDSQLAKAQDLANRMAEIKEYINSIPWRHSEAVAETRQAEAETTAGVNAEAKKAGSNVWKWIETFFKTIGESQAEQQEFNDKVNVQQRELESEGASALLKWTAEYATKFAKSYVEEKQLEAENEAKLGASMAEANENAQQLTKDYFNTLAELPSAIAYFATEMIPGYAEEVDAWYAKADALKTEADKAQAAADKEAKPGTINTTKADKAVISGLEGMVNQQIAQSQLNIDAQEATNEMIANTAKDVWSSFVDRKEAQGIAEMKAYDEQIQAQSDFYDWLGGKISDAYKWYMKSGGPIELLSKLNGYLLEKHDEIENPTPLTNPKKVTGSELLNTADYTAIMQVIDTGRMTQDALSEWIENYRDKAKTLTAEEANALQVYFDSYTEQQDRNKYLATNEDGDSTAALNKRTDKTAYARNLVLEGFADIFDKTNEKYDAEAVEGLKDVYGITNERELYNYIRDNGNEDALRRMGITELGEDMVYAMEASGLLSTDDMKDLLRSGEFHIERNNSPGTYYSAEEMDSMANTIHETASEWYNNRWLQEQVNNTGDTASTLKETKAFLEKHWNDSTGKAESVRRQLNENGYVELDDTTMDKLEKRILNGTVGGADNMLDSINNLYEWLTNGNGRFISTEQKELLWGMAEQLKPVTDAVVDNVVSNVSSGATTKKQAEQYIKDNKGLTDDQIERINEAVESKESKKDYEEAQKQVEKAVEAANTEDKEDDKEATIEHAGFTWDSNKSFMQNLSALVKSGKDIYEKWGLSKSDGEWSLSGSGFLSGILSKFLGEDAVSSVLDENGNLTIGSSLSSLVSAIFGNYKSEDGTSLLDLVGLGNLSSTVESAVDTLFGDSDSSTDSIDTLTDALDANTDATNSSTSASSGTTEAVESLGKSLLYDEIMKNRFNWGADVLADKISEYDNWDKNHDDKPAYIEGMEKVLGVTYEKTANGWERVSESATEAATTTASTVASAITVATSGTLHGSNNKDYTVDGKAISKMTDTEVDAAKDLVDNERSILDYLKKTAVDGKTTGGLDDEVFAAKIKSSLGLSDTEWTEAVAELKSQGLYDTYASSGVDVSNIETERKALSDIYSSLQYEDRYREIDSSNIGEIKRTVSQLASDAGEFFRTGKIGSGSTTNNTTTTNSGNIINQTFNSLANVRPVDIFRRTNSAFSRIFN